MVVLLVQGAISFGDENLSTTGTLASGALSVTGTGAFSSTISAATGSSVGNLTLADGSITDSSGSILEMRILAQQEHLLQALSL